VAEWVFAACMLFCVVPAMLMLLVAECLVHIGSMCLGALPFADQNSDHGLALMTDSTRAMHLC
jgi:hypothetical protein